MVDEIISSDANKDVSMNVDKDTNTDVAIDAPKNTTRLPRRRAKKSATSTKNENPHPYMGLDGDVNKAGKPTIFPISIILLSILPPVLLLFFDNFNVPFLYVLSALVLIVLASFGWGVLTQAPDNKVSVTILLIIGVINVFLVGYTQEFAWSLIVMFLAVPLCFIAEIMRGSSRSHVTWSMAVSITGAVIVVCAAGWALFPAYPVMGILSWIVLPSLIVSALTLTIKCSRNTFRILIAVCASLIVGIIVTFAYGQKFSELFALAFVSSNHPILVMWCIGIGFALLSGLVFSATSVIFIIPESGKTKLMQFTLLLLPTICMVIPIYTLARFVTG